MSRKVGDDVKEGYDPISEVDEERLGEENETDEDHGFADHDEVNRGGENQDQDHDDVGSDGQRSIGRGVSLKRSLDGGKNLINLNQKVESATSAATTSSTSTTSASDSPDVPEQTHAVHFGRYATRNNDNAAKNDRKHPSITKIRNTNNNAGGGRPVVLFLPPEGNRTNNAVDQDSTVVQNNQESRRK